MTPIARLSPALLLIGLAGCATAGHDYFPPPLEAPVAYAAQPAGVSNNSIETAWWSLFRDPALDALITEALAANLDARLAVARLDEARALARVSRAGLLPSGSVGASYQRRRLADTERPGGQARESDTLRLGAEVSWEIDLFGRVRRGAEAAGAEVGGAEALLRSARAAVVADVASRYFELRGNEAALTTAHRQVEIQRRSVELTRKLEAAGAGARFDIIRAEARLSAVEAVLPQHEQRISAAHNALAVLLGRPPQGFKGPGPSAPGTKLPQVAKISVGTPAELLRRRPDIAAAERTLAATHARLGIARADLFPTVRLTGFIGLLTGGFGSLFTSGALAFSGGPALDWGVFDMARLRAQVGVADARADAALIEYHRTVLTALREVEDALSAYGAVRTRLASLTEQATASREAARMASVRFREGEGQYLDVLEAERTLYEAEAMLIDARAQHLVTVVEIYRSLGGGWEVCETPNGPSCIREEPEISH